MLGVHVKLRVSVTDGRKTKWGYQELASCKGGKSNMVSRLQVDVGAIESFDIIQLRCYTTKWMGE